MVSLCGNLELPQQDFTTTTCPEVLDVAVGAEPSATITSGILSLMLACFGSVVEVEAEPSATITSGIFSLMLACLGLEARSTALLLPIAPCIKTPTAPYPTNEELNAIMQRARNAKLKQKAKKDKKRQKAKQRKL
jgi:hypothetical protein